MSWTKASGLRLALQTVEIHMVIKQSDTSDEQRHFTNSHTDNHDDDSKTHTTKVIMTITMKLIAIMARV